MKVAGLTEFSVLMETTVNSHIKKPNPILNDLSLPKCHVVTTKEMFKRDSRY